MTIFATTRSSEAAEDSARPRYSGSVIGRSSHMSASGRALERVERSHHLSEAARSEAQPSGVS
jgi:hypothetical protein